MEWIGGGGRMAECPKVDRSGRRCSERRRRRLTGRAGGGHWMNQGRAGSGTGEEGPSGSTEEAAEKELRR
jgi:hypothetical protein